MTRMYVCSLAERRGVMCWLRELHPAFRERCEMLLDLVPTAAVWETYRSPQRAETLAERGTGKARSVHCLRVACDFVHAELLWDAPGHWWSDLGRAMEHLRLYRVKRRAANGKTTFWDLPHCQATPPALDKRLWTMQPDVRETFVASHLRDRRVPTTPFELLGADVYPRESDAL